MSEEKCFASDVIRAKLDENRYTRPDYFALSMVLAVGAIFIFYGVLALIENPETLANIVFILLGCLPFTVWFLGLWAERTEREKLEKLIKMGIRVEGWSSKRSS